MAKNFWDLVTSVFLAMILFALIYIVVVTSWDVTKEAKLAAVVSLLVGFGIFVAKWITKHNKEELDKKADKATLDNHIKEDDERYRSHRRFDEDRYEEVRLIMEQNMDTIKESRDIVSRIEGWVISGQIVKKIVKQ